MGVGDGGGGGGVEGGRVGWNGAIEMALTGNEQRESFVQGKWLSSRVVKGKGRRGGGGYRRA